MNQKIKKYLDAKKYDLALREVNKINKKNSNLDNINTRSLIYLYLQKFNAALEDLLILNKHFPNNPEILCNLGLAYKGLKNYDLSKKFLIYSIAIDKHFIQSYLNLSEVHIELNEYVECIELLKKFHIFNQNIERSFQILATCYRELNKFKEHHDALLKCISINPYNYENYFHLGYSYLWLNDKNNAIDAFKKSYQYNKLNFAALYQINKIKKFSINDEIIKELSCKKFQNVPSNHLSYLELLLSDIFYEIGDFNNFFIKLHKANQLRNISLINNKTSLNIPEIQTSFHAVRNKNFIFKNPSFIPIFILGMPRSGSSLLEQILASNQNIYGAGEVSLLHSFFERNFHNKIEINNEFLSEIKNRYTSHILALSNKPYVIDKLPLNFFWIGFIKIIFPNAIFINTVRNKTNTCMSLYRTFFAPGSLDFSYDMKKINHFYNLYISQINFWIDHKIKIINFCYEDFINQPTNYMKGLFNEIGINFSNEYLQIDKNDRPVKTASMNQIRNKIEKIKYPEWSNFRNQISLFF